MPRFYSICQHCEQKTVFDTLSVLKCESCGAPLKEFHRIETPEAPKTPEPQPAQPQPEPIIVERVIEREVVREVPVKSRDDERKSDKKSKKKKKKKKSGLKKLADFADDIFDIFD